jgi:hypothetical protein
MERHRAVLARRGVYMRLLALRCGGSSSRFKQVDPLCLVTQLLQMRCVGV